MKTPLPKPTWPAPGPSGRTARNVLNFLGLPDEDSIYPENGWLLYDAACPFCTRLARRFDTTLLKRGIQILPLQTAWVKQFLAERRQPILKEIRFLSINGRLTGGADALLEVAAHFPWIRPLCALAELPGALPALRRAYRFVADHRHCLLKPAGRRTA